MRTIHVVTIDPLPGQAAIGGYDWFFKREDAETRFDHYAGDDTTRYRRWTATVPEEWDGGAIEEYVADTFVNNDPEGWPEQDTHQLTNEAALDNAIFLLNTFAHPDASDREDVDRAEFFLHDTVRLLIEMKENA